MNNNLNIRDTYIFKAYAAEFGYKVMSDKYGIVVYYKSWFSNYKILSIIEDKAYIFGVPLTNSLLIKFYEELTETKLDVVLSHDKPCETYILEYA